MGDRVSISFKNGSEESVVLFSHWGGVALIKVAEEYSKALVNEIGTKSRITPLERLEPATVMVDFIRSLTASSSRVKSNLYLGATPADGDNSDNGHHVIDLTTAR